LNLLSAALRHVECSAPRDTGALIHPRRARNDTGLLSFRVGLPSQFKLVTLKDSI
jgi:hypothetical protein